MYPHTSTRQPSDQSRVTMPIFSFCAVVGVTILSLICFAEDILGAPRQLSVSTNFHGLPKPSKVGASVEALTVREASAPQASAGEQGLSQAPEVVPPKKVAITSKSGKTKKAVKVVRTRPRSESHAHVIGIDFPRMW